MVWSIHCYFDVLKFVPLHKDISTFKCNRYPDDFVNLCIQFFLVNFILPKKISNGCENAIIDNSLIFGSFIF